MARISLNSLIENALFRDNEELCVFCGAGISYNSGLPVVADLLAYIVTKLDNPALDKRLILRCNLPFEAIIETLREQTDIGPIIGIFQQGGPNVNHIILAKLVKLGIVRTIATTNFDTLIEEAFINEGLVEGQDFVVCWSDRQFKIINWKKRVVRILKLHGTANHRKSVQITMARVASRANAPHLRGIINYIFSSGRHKRVIVMGYSCSDHFDISPCIELVGARKREVNIINHFRGATCSTEPVSHKVNNNPFKQFVAGQRIYCNTDRFIRSIWRRYRSKFGKMPTQAIMSHNESWRKHVDSWFDSIEDRNRRILSYHLVSRLLIKSNYFKAAKVQMEHSLKHSVAKKQRYYEAQAAINLGICSYRLSKFNESFAYHKRALKLSRKLGDKKLEGNTLGNIGNVYYSLDRYSLAERYQKRALLTAKEHRLKPLMANTLGNLGIIYEQRHDHRKALLYHRQALSAARIVGDAIGIARHMFNIGLVYSTDHNMRAVTFLNRSIVMAETTGQRNILAGCHFQLGKFYFHQGDHILAEDHLKKALLLSEQLDHFLGAAESIEILNQLYAATRQTRKRQHLIQKAKVLMRKVPMGVTGKQRREIIDKLNCLTMPCSQSA